jgi:hypothetical protein
MMALGMGASYNRMREQEMLRRKRAGQPEQQPQPAQAFDAYATSPSRPATALPGILATTLGPRRGSPPSGPQVRTTMREPFGPGMNPRPQPARPAPAQPTAPAAAVAAAAQAAATSPPQGSSPARAASTDAPPVSDYDRGRAARELAQRRSRVLHQMTQTPRNARGGLIDQRHELERDMRDLSAATAPAPRVQDLDEIDRNRNRLRSMLPAARAAYQGSAPDVAPPADAALAAGEQMVRGTPLARPGLSPQTELMRRSTLRFAAGGADGVEGTGTDAALSSPESREVARRTRMRAMGQQTQPAPEMQFEGTAADVRAGQERNVARVEADRTAALPHADAVVRRMREQDLLRRRAQEAPVEAGVSEFEAQTAANREAADPAIREVERRARLDMMRAQAAQQAGAAATAQRESSFSVAGIDNPDSFMEAATAGATALRKATTAPGGSFLTALGQNENGVVWQPDIEAAQNFLNTTVQQIERLAQTNPASASTLAADALLAMPEADAGGEYTVAGYILQPTQGAEAYQSKQVTARLLTDARRRLQSLAGGTQSAASR